MEVIDRVEFELLENDSIVEARLHYLNNDTAAAVEKSLAFLVAKHSFTNLKSNIRRILCPGLEADTKRADSHARLSILQERTYVNWVYTQRGSLNIFLGVCFKIKEDYGYNLSDAFAIASHVTGRGSLICGALIGHHYRHQQHGAEFLALEHKMGTMGT
ncbi:hypothetical protein BGAL_0127g00150 [Botrytis galanthina]|uniref:Uncharacterized protein n=1 Tax=Botrytis galanthina TaxID=278940 RepID=A0A4V6T701_9HELO|nr:hypothetical protein BGAL_0127g00150 [Botrytis galanthina]